MQDVLDVRKRIATNDAQYTALDEKLTELKEREEKVIETLTTTKSSLELVKDQIDKLRLEQESLIDKREKKQSSRQSLLGKKASMSGEVNLAEVNGLIRGIDEVVAISSCDFSGYRYYHKKNSSSAQHWACVIASERCSLTITSTCFEQKKPVQVFFKMFL